MSSGIHAKYPPFLSDFNENLIFSTYCRNTLQNNFHENPSSWSELFHADRQTDGLKVGRTVMTKPIVAVRNFAIAPKNADVRNVGQGKARQGKCHRLQLCLFKWPEVPLQHKLGKSRAGSAGQTTDWTYWILSQFSHSYRASWYNQSFLFTNWCTSELS